MTSAQTEIFRKDILLQLRAVNGGSLPVPTLVSGVKAAGFDEANDAIVRASLTYLADKGLVAIVPVMLSPENKRWRITAAGVDLLAEAGL